MLTIFFRRRQHVGIHVSQNQLLSTWEGRCKVWPMPFVPQKPVLDMCSQIMRVHGRELDTYGPFYLHTSACHLLSLPYYMFRTIPKSVSISDFWRICRFWSRRFLCMSDQGWGCKAGQFWMWMDRNAKKWRARDQARLSEAEVTILSIAPVILGIRYEE